jgi:hypothetical protein
VPKSLFFSGSHHAVGRHLAFLSTTADQMCASSVRVGQSGSAEGTAMQRREFICVIAGASAVPFIKSAVAQEPTEKLFASDSVVRTILTFRAPDAAVQKTLPAGWELNPPATGPDTGANLIVYVTDFQMIHDAQGKPLPTRPSVALIVPAKKSGSNLTAFMVTGGFTAEAGTPGPYGVFAPAKVTVDRRSRRDGDGTAIIDESWEMNATDGSALEFRVRFQRGAPDREKVAWQYYSAAKPDFHRTYRIDHGVDVVRSLPAGVDRVSTFVFKATGPKLAPLFDGSERLISITSIPFYSRSIYLHA